MVPAPFTAGRVRQPRGRGQIGAAACVVLAALACVVARPAAADCCQCGAPPGPVTCGPAIGGACDPACAFVPDAVCDGVCVPHTPTPTPTASATPLPSPTPTPSATATPDDLRDCCQCGTTFPSCGAPTGGLCAAGCAPVPDAVCVGSLGQCATRTPTPVPTPTGTATATPTLTPTPSPSAPGSPTPTATPSDTPTAPDTPTLTPSPTATPTDTPSPSPSPTETPTPAPTDTPTPAPPATATPGPGDCCQCERPTACGPPVDGQCSAGCVPVVGAACQPSGLCAPHTPAATPTGAPPGPCVVLSVDGPGDGMPQNVAVGCEANWECVRTDDGDLSYVASGLPRTERVDLYRLAPAPPRDDPVGELRVVVVARAVNGSGTVRPALWLPLTGLRSPRSFPPGSAYETFVVGFPLNPQTGAPWRWSDLEALQAGIRQEARSADEVRTTSVTVEVCPAEPTATPTTTASPTATPTPTPTPSPSATGSPTPTATPSDTPTAPDTPTLTPSPTATPTDTPSPSPSPTETPTPAPTDTPTPAPPATATPTRAATPTDTAAPTPTPTPEPTATVTPTHTPTATPADTPTPTPFESPTPSASPTPPATETPTRTPSPAPPATDTPSPSPAAPTATPTVSATPSRTPTRTGTPPTATPTAPPRIDYLMPHGENQWACAFDLQGAPPLLMTSRTTPIAQLPAANVEALRGFYQAIWVAPGLGTRDYQLLQELVAPGGVIERFVAQGGVAVLNVAGTGGDWPDIAPGGVDFVAGPRRDAQVVEAPLHPYVTGLGYGGEPLGAADFRDWLPSDYGTLAELPPGATIVLQNGDGPTWAEYDHGDGRVIVTTLAYCYADRPLTQGAATRNLLRYARFYQGAARTPAPTVTVTPTPTVTPTRTATRTRTPTLPATRTRTPTPTPAVRAGDVNGDGVVDGRDLAALLAALYEDPPLPPAAADLNADGRITAADVARWMELAAE